MAVFFCKMKNLELQPNYLITLPKRGVKVIAPEHTQAVMARAKANKLNGTTFTDEEKQKLWPEEEKARLKIMTNCGTLKRRYPQKEDGETFMKDIDYQRRDELLDRACDLTVEVVSSWEKLKPETPIAVILFGSVAKGLVKREDHPDPSNIDIAVIGEITKEERNSLLDAIRPKRIEIQNEILAKVPSIDSAERNPGNAGVIVQDMEKLTKENYSQTKNYIASGAVALYDPSGLWQKLEIDALKHEAEKAKGKKKKLEPHVVFEAKNV